MKKVSMMNSMNKRTEMKLRNTISAVFIALAIFASPVILPAQDSSDSSKKLTKKADTIKNKIENLILSMTKLADELKEQDPEAAKVLRQAADSARESLISQDAASVVSLLRQLKLNEALKKQQSLISKLDKLLVVLDGSKANSDELKKQLQVLREVLKEIRFIRTKQEKAEIAFRAYPNKKDILKRLPVVVETLKKQNSKLDFVIANANKLASATASEKQLAQAYIMLQEIVEQQNRLNKNYTLIPVSMLGEYAEFQQSILLDFQKLLKFASSKSAVAKAFADDKIAAHIKTLLDAMTKSIAALEKNDIKKAKAPVEQTLYDLNAIQKLLRKFIIKSLGKGVRSEMILKMNSAIEPVKQQQEKIEYIVSWAGLDIALIPGGQRVAQTGDMKFILQNIQEIHDKTLLGNFQGIARAAKDAKVEIKHQLAKLATVESMLNQKTAKSPDSFAQKKVADNLKKQILPITKIGNEFKNVAKAIKKTSDLAYLARKQMRKQETYIKAHDSQLKVLDEIDSVIKLMLVHIREVKRKQADDRLSKILKALGKMIAAQTKCNNDTIAVFKAAKGTPKVYDRAAKQNLAVISQAEAGLANEIDKLLKFFEEDELAVAFPEILRSTKKDILTVAKDLSDAKAGRSTQMLQAIILSDLKSLISAARDSLSDGPPRKDGEGKGGGGSGGGGNEKKKALVPPVTELKLLRMRQLRAAALMDKIAAQIKTGKLSNKEALDMLSRLRTRQEKVTGLAKRIFEKTKRKSKSGSIQRRPKTSR